MEINEPMEDLIVRSLQGRTTPQEEARLRTWRESTWENGQRYSALAELWSLVGAAGMVSESAVPPAVDVVVARAEAVEENVAGGWEGKAVVAAAVAARWRQSWGVRWRRRSVVGALAAVLAGVGLGLVLLFNGLLGPKESLAFDEVTTGAGERATVTLSDNTAVRLGHGSTLRLLEGGEHSVVWLEGRAFFGVEPDPSRTFTVRTRYGDAIALGTRFEVRTDEEEFRVLVVQGNVRVSSSGRSVELGEGLMSRNVQGAPPATSSVEDVDAQLDWIGQTLVFRATPLSRVILEIEHRYGVTVELASEALSNLTVTATFTDQPVESVLFVVCEIVGAGCTVEEGRYRIGDRGLGSLRPGMQPAPAPMRMP